VEGRCFHTPNTQGASTYMSQRLQSKVFSQFAIPWSTVSTQFVLLMFTFFSSPQGESLKLCCKQSLCICPARPCKWQEVVTQCSKSVASRLSLTLQKPTKKSPGKALTWRNGSSTVCSLISMIPCKSWCKKAKGKNIQQAGFPDGHPL
jgi:hypothetical protein